jgi:serine/threonine protein kinase
MDFAESWGPGHVIAGKYRLVRQLGKGGMGSVWAADHLALSSEVAIKIIDPAIARNQEALARFLREAQSAAALRSPHVVQTFDYGVHEDVPSPSRTPRRFSPRSAEPYRERTRPASSIAI